MINIFFASFLILAFHAAFMQTIHYWHMKNIERYLLSPQPNTETLMKLAKPSFGNLAFDLFVIGNLTFLVVSIYFFS